ncbi:RNA polymerase sigma factor [Labrenzia sp. DG1229]|uniref:RNA polymerase sigma factor n=1 Tax=Labrenzia sp. DG1229 TaxID=681847 RepID=UPI001AD8BBA3|nr:RNA polymerase sigma factor [Labrenzia sp. DG1229]
MVTKRRNGFSPRTHNTRWSHLFRSINQKKSGLKDQFACCPSESGFAENFLSDEALKTEMIRLLPKLRSFALRLCRNPDQADDLVQTTCERAIRSLDQFDPATRLDSWMFRILQNLYFNTVRDGANRARLFDLAMMDFEESYDGAKAAASSLELQKVQSFIGQLEEDNREVLLKIAIEGQSYKDVAEELGVPIGTVTSRLARARLKLREFLEAKDTAPGVALRSMPGGMS